MSWDSTNIAKKVNHQGFFRTKDGLADKPTQVVPVVTSDNGSPSASPQNQTQRQGGSPPIVMMPTALSPQQLQQQRPSLPNQQPQQQQQGYQHPPAPYAYDSNTANNHQTPQRQQMPPPSINMAHQQQFGGGGGGGVGNASPQFSHSPQPANFRGQQNANNDYYHGTSIPNASSPQSQADLQHRLRGVAKSAPADITDKITGSRAWSKDQVNRVFPQTDGQNGNPFSMGRQRSNSVPHGGGNSPTAGAAGMRGQLEPLPTGYDLTRSLYNAAAPSPLQRQLAPQPPSHLPPINAAPTPTAAGANVGQQQQQMFSGMTNSTSQRVDLGNMSMNNPNAFNGNRMLMVTNGGYAMMGNGGGGNNAGGHTQQQGQQQQQYDPRRVSGQSNISQQTAPTSQQQQYSFRTIDPNPSADLVRLVNTNYQEAQRSYLQVK